MSLYYKYLFKIFPQYYMGNYRVIALQIPFKKCSSSKNICNSNCSVSLENGGSPYQLMFNSVMSVIQDLFMGVKIMGAVLKVDLVQMQTFYDRARPLIIFRLGFFICKIGKVIFFS